jgi:hypothetical protein
MASLITLTAAAKEKREHLDLRGFKLNNSESLTSN